MNRHEVAALAKEICDFLTMKQSVFPEDVDYILRSLNQIRPTVYGWNAEIDNAIGRVRKLRTFNRRTFEADKQAAIDALVGIAIQAANFE